MSRLMLTLPGWQRVGCVVADVMRASNLLQPLSSLTDPDGIYGHPVIFIEWGLRDGEPLLREYRWPADPSRDCEHYVPAQDEPSTIDGRRNHERPNER